MKFVTLNYLINFLCLFIRIGGSPSDMCWDQNGKRLAITFKNSSALVVFQTSINETGVECIPL